MKKKSSVGLLIIGVLFILQGLFGFRAIFLYPSIAKNLLFLAYGTFYTMVVIITGVGIFLLKRWARIMALVLVAIKTIQLIAGIVNDIPMIKKSAEFASIHPPISSLIIAIIIILIVGGGFIYYLTRSKVKEQFEGI